VFVAVPVGPLVDVWVGVAEGPLVAVLVGVAVGVLVGVFVGVGVGVLVGVFVGVGVFVAGGPPAGWSAASPGKVVLWISKRLVQPSPSESSGSIVCRAAALRP
jgi:hypothetical protein